MKLKILILLIFLGIPIVKAETYYSNFKPLNENNYKIEEIKKYRWYKQEEISGYFIEGENPQNYSEKETDSFYYTAYSRWDKILPATIQNREVVERNVYIYQPYNKIKHISLEIDGDGENITEFKIISDGLEMSKNAFCNGCQNGYYMMLNDNDYDTPTKVGKLLISLEEYYEPDSLEFVIAFKEENVRYRIIIYETNAIDEKIYYQKEFLSEIGLKKIKISDLDVYESAYGKEEILYELNDLMHLKTEYKEYSYRDKYILYYKTIKDYYPTYEINVEGYFKDENDFIIDKQYYERDLVLIKDSIVITSNNYNLDDYIKTNLPYETASNIDISKNGKYKIKYILPFKTIEKEVTVATNNEYVESLELKLKNKDKELVDVINLKNEMIEKLESNIKTKDDIISKKSEKVTIKSTNFLPVILITIGVMFLIFAIYKSFNRNVEIKK